MLNCALLNSAFLCKLKNFYERQGRKRFFMNIIELLEKEQLRDNIPQFGPGDTVRVHAKIVEGTRERIQVFEGVVIGRQGSGVREMFTVRRISYGVGVERMFPVHSPRIDKIEVTRRGKVRRAKLYYLRDKIGKDSKVKTLVGAKVAAAMAARNAAAAEAAKAKEAAAAAAAEAPAAE